MGVMRDKGLWDVIAFSLRSAQLCILHCHAGGQGGGEGRGRGGTSSLACAFPGPVPSPGVLGCYPRCLKLAKWKAAKCHDCRECQADIEISGIRPSNERGGKKA